MSVCKFAIGQRWRWRDPDAVCDNAGSTDTAIITIVGYQADINGQERCRVRFHIEGHTRACPRSCAHGSILNYSRQTIAEFADHVL